MTTLLILRGRLKDVVAVADHAVRAGAGASVSDNLLLAERFSSFEIPGPKDEP